MTTRLIWAALLLVAAYGCTEDTQPETGDAGGDGVLIDGSAGSGGQGGADQGAGGDNEVGPNPDSGRADAGTDAAVPDAGAVERCQDACDRYAACERLDVWGDEGACLDACERAEQGSDLSGWYECIQAEACGLIQLCRLPEPPPLSCDEVCQLAEGCAVALPFADCAAECAAFEGAEPLAACAESLTVCDTAGFGACMAERVFPDCGQRCARTEGCNIEGPACLADCVLAGLDPDPLRRARQQERNTCVALPDEDCERVNQCLHPDSAPEIPEVIFCRAWDRCFAEAFPCELLNQIISRDDPNRNALLACGLEHLEFCPDDPLFMLERCLGAGGAGPTCQDLCAAQDVCGALPAGAADALACGQACLEGLLQSPDQAARVAAQLPCGRAERCPELEACLDEVRPDVACVVFCDVLSGCDLAEASCAEACEQSFFRPRGEAARACVDAAGEDCAALEACVPTSPVGCEAICDRQRACQAGEFDLAGCLTRCDATDFEDPEAHLRAVACVLTAPVCDDWRVIEPLPHAVNRCGEHGLGCLGWCRLTMGCAEEGEMAACLDACGAGVAGEPGVQRLLADDCLAGAEDCDALAACVPAEPPPCAAWCDALQVCGVERPGCDARCDGDALTQYRAYSQAPCLLAAAGDCEAVVACAAPEEAVLAVDTSEQSFCGQYARCGLGAELPCDAFYATAAAQGEAALGCMIEQMERACPAAVLELLEACPGADHDRQVACESLCALRAVCDDLGGTDLRQCRGACIEVFSFGEGERRPLEAELPCAEAWSCADLVTCRATLDPAAQCQSHCAALQGCGLPDEGCMQACDQRFAYERDGAWRACVRAAGDDCDAVAACAPMVPDCPGYCQAAGACGILGEDCERACDDAHFAEPATQTLRIMCALGMEACFDGAQPDAVSMEDCVRGDPTRGLDPDCAPYCRAVTDCDAGAERTFDGCMFQCAEGLPGDEGLTFAAARGCTSDLGVQAGCAELVACLPETPPALDCDAHCAAMSACGVAEDGCEAACGVAADRGAVACTLEVTRTERGCEPLAACVGFEAPPVPAACQQLCAEQAICAPASDGFVCRLGCSPAPEGLEYQVACAQYTDCDGRAACDEVNAADPACVAPCDTAAACGGPEAADCVVECTGYRASPSSDAVAEQALLDCLGAAGDVPECAHAVNACFDAVGALCDEACVYLVGCGLAEAAQCGQDCRQNSQGNAQFEDELHCVIEALEGDVCDILTAIQCIGF